MTNIIVSLWVTMMALAGSQSLGQNHVSLHWEENGAPVYTDADTLSREITWKAGHEPLPTKLETLIALGKAEIVRADNLTNQPDLQEIVIERIELTSRLLEEAG